MTESETTTDTMTGGCQCGAVRYAVRVSSDEAYYCHCRMCQKAFGNIFATLFQVSKDAVTWKKGEPAYYHSSKIARRGFCRDCGTPLTFDYLDSKKMDLSVGSLDHPERMRPVAHVGAESRVPSWAWKDELPTSRTEDNAKYVQKWKAAYGPDAMPGPVVQPEEG